MDRATFLKLLAERFYPLLRAEAFRGSGTTLRRVQQPVIHVVNVQGSTSADGFYVNLGAHLTFLPTEGSQACVPAKLKEYECAFRARIAPPLGALRWPYGQSITQAEATLGQLAEGWEKQGRAFFTQHSQFPGRFVSLIRAALADPPHPRDGLKYARIAAHVGLREEAVVLARQSLANVAEGAAGLRGTLKRFLDELGAAHQSDGAGDRRPG